MTLRTCCLPLVLLAAAAGAAEPVLGTTGKAELGFLATSGNTDTSSLNAKFSLVHEGASSRQTVSATAVKAEDSGLTTAERYQAGYQFDYKFAEHDYLWASVNWEQDEFAGFSARTAEAIGYGRRTQIGTAHHFAFEVGAGARQTDPLVGADLDETIVRLSGKYQWKISEGAAFDQSLVFEKGDDNTYSESVTALGAKLNGALGFKFSYTIKDNSVVAPGLENTDTFTAVSLEYTF